VRIYETTFIVNPQSDDSVIESKVKAITDLITARGGKIVHENRIGTRRLAYTIRHLTQGYYTSLIFEAEPPIIPEIERVYKLDEAYLRFLTIAFEGDLNNLSGGEKEIPMIVEDVKEEEPEEDVRPLRGRREERRTFSSARTAEDIVENKTGGKTADISGLKKEIDEVVDNLTSEDDTEVTSLDDEEL